jgi:hypothetical protein
MGLYRIAYKPMQLLCNAIHDMTYFTSALRDRAARNTRGAFVAVAARSAQAGRRA